MSRRCSVAALTVFALIWVTACAGGVDVDARGGSTGTTGTVPPAPTVALCEDVPMLGPIRVGNQPGNANPDFGIQGVLLTYVSKHADTFAGQWIDRVHGGTIVLAFTDDPAAHLAAIKALRPSPDDESPVMPKPTITDTTTVGESPWMVDTVKASHSVTELERVLEQIHSSQVDLGGATISSSGLDVMRNRAWIELDPASDTTRQLLARELSTDGLCVRPSPSGATWPAEVPKPASLIPPEGSDPWITCGGGIPFPASNLDDHPTLSSDDPLAVAFRSSLTAGGGVPPSGDPSSYYLLARTDTKALFATGSPASGLVTFSLEEGRWIWQGSGGGCSQPHALAPPGLGQVDWTLDSTFPPPGPADTTIHVLVEEIDCRSGQPVGDRLTVPEIDARDNQILVAFAAKVPPGTSFECPGNPTTPVTVTLPEPLGNRTLADGAFVPPRPATSRAEGPIR